jgi:hypothetical protein
LNCNEQEDLMLRSLFILTAAGLASAPAVAATYAAKPAVPTNERFVAHDIVWNCSAAVCRGATADSRPAVLCQSLAKHAGRIESFAVDGRAFAAADLDKCNAAAKARPSAALAAQ